MDILSKTISNKNFNILDRQSSNINETDLGHPNSRTSSFHETLSSFPKTTLHQLLNNNQNPLSRLQSEPKFDQQKTKNGGGGEDHNHHHRHTHFPIPLRIPSKVGLQSLLSEKKNQLQQLVLPTPLLIPLVPDDDEKVEEVGIRGFGTGRKNGNEVDSLVKIVEQSELSSQFENNRELKVGYENNNQCRDNLAKEIEYLKNIVEKQDQLFNTLKMNQEVHLNSSSPSIIDPLLLLKFDALEKQILEGKNKQKNDEIISQLQNKAKLKSEEEKQKQKDNEECVNCTINEEMTLRKGSEILKLREQIERAKKMFNFANTVQTQNTKLKSQITSISALNESQNETIKLVIHSTNLQKEELKDLQRQLKDSKKLNSGLAKIELELKGIIEQIKNKVVGLKLECEKERVFRGTWEGVIEEWKRCVEIIEGDDIEVNFEDPRVYSGVVVSEVKKLKKQLSALKLKIETNDKEILTIGRERSTLLTKYGLEMQKKESELDIAKERLRDLIDLSETTRRERDLAMKSCEDTQKEYTKNIQSTSREMERNEREMSETLQKSNDELKRLKTQQDDDKYEFKRKIEELQSRQSELQIEVSQLRREKNSYRSF